MLLLVPSSRHLNSLRNGTCMVHGFRVQMHRDQVAHPATATKTMVAGSSANITDTSSYSRSGSCVDAFI